MSPNLLSRALGLVLLASTGRVMAGTLDYQLYTAVMHSDNITLVPDHPISQTVVAPGLSFNWLQQGANLQATASGGLEYRDFLGSRFNNQKAIQLASKALWTIAPKRLDLMVQDYASEQPLDALASDAPGNRQQTNVFMAGPILHFALGPTMRGQAELRYLNSYAEKTDTFNSNRTQAAIRIIKDLSPTSRVSLNASTEHIDLYKTDLYPNYDRDDAFVHYVSELKKVDLDLQAGTTRIRSSHTTPSSRTTPLLRASATWQVSVANSLTLAGRRQYSDAVQDLTLRAGTDDPMNDDFGISTGDTMVDPQIFLERKVEIGYGFHGERFSASLIPFYRKLAYIGDPRYDQTGRGGNVALAYRITPTFNVRGYWSRQNLRYTSLERMDKTSLSGIDFTAQRNQHWSWRAGVLHRYRHSSIHAQSYNETEVYVAVIFRR